MKKKLIVTLVALAAIAVIVVYMKLSGFALESTSYANLYEAFNLIEIDGSTAAEDTYAVVLQGQLSEYRAIFSDEVYYVDFNIVKDTISDKFYWDENQNLLIFTTPTNMIKTKIGKSKYYVSNKKKSWDNDITMMVDGSLYVDINFVSQYTGATYTTYKDPNRICIVYDFSELPYAYINEPDSIRCEADKTSDIYKDGSIGDELLVIEDEGTWTKVQSEDGIIGYIKTDSLTDVTYIAADTEFEAPEYTSISMDSDVSLAWHQVGGIAGNDTLGEYMLQVNNVNVVSPTWFTLTNAKGSIESFATSDYVTKAHNMGCQVWALVDDFTQGKDGQYLMEKVLSKTSTRQKFIKNIVNEVKACGADGINIDFEHISTEEAADYIEFLRELSIRCRNSGLVLSVDDYVPADWSYYYNRAAQAEVADYIVVMCYDEYNTSSTEAGPVSSFTYVDEGIKNTISEIGEENANKVVMGLSFFTRVWVKTPEEYADSDATIIEDSVNGNYSLTSTAVSMDVANETYSTYGATPVWDDETGSYYVSYTNENTQAFTQIWLEDAESIGNKLDLVSQYGIAGAAYWKLGMETADIWDVVGAKLN